MTRLFWLFIPLLAAATNTGYLLQQPITIPSSAMTGKVLDFYLPDSHNFLIAQQNNIVGWNEQEPNMPAFKHEIESYQDQSNYIILFGDQLTSIVGKSKNYNSGDYLNVLSNQIEPSKIIPHMNHRYQKFSDVILFDDQTTISTGYFQLQSKAAIVKTDASGSVVSTLLFETDKPPGKIIKTSIDSFIIAIDHKVLIFNKDTMKLVSSLNINNLDQNFLSYNKVSEQIQLFIVKLKDKSYDIYSKNNTTYSFLSSITEEIKEETLNFLNSTHVNYVKKDASQLVIQSAFIPYKLIGKTSFETSPWMKSTIVSNYEGMLISEQNNLRLYIQEYNSYAIIKEAVSSLQNMQKAWYQQQNKNPIIYSFGYNATKQKKILQMFKYQTNTISEYQNLIDVFVDSRGFLFSISSNGGKIYLLVSKMTTPDTISQSQEITLSEAVSYAVKQSAGFQYLISVQQTLRVLVIISLKNGTFVNQYWRYGIFSQTFSCILNITNGFSSNILAFGGYRLPSIYLQVNKEQFFINLFSGVGDLAGTLPITDNFITVKTIYNVLTIFLSNGSCTSYQIFLKDTNKSDIIKLSTVVIPDLNFNIIDKEDIRIFRDLRKYTNLTNIIISFPYNEYTYFYNSIVDFTAIPLPKTTTSTLDSVVQTITDQQSIEGLKTSYLSDNIFTRIKYHDGDLIIYKMNLSKFLQNCLNYSFVQYYTLMDMSWGIIGCQRNNSTLIISLKTPFPFYRYEVEQSYFLPDRNIAQSHNYVCQGVYIQSDSEKQTSYYYPCSNKIENKFSQKGTIQYASKNGIYMLLKTAAQQFSVINLKKNQIYYNTTDPTFTLGVIDIDDTGNWIAFVDDNYHMVKIYYMNNYYLIVNFKNYISEIKFLGSGYLVIKSDFQFAIINYETDRKIRLLQTNLKGKLAYTFSQDILAYSLDNQRITLMYFNGTKLPDINSGKVFSKLRMNPDGLLLAYIEDNKFLKWSLGTCSNNKIIQNAACVCPSQLVELESGCGCSQGFYLRENSCLSCSGLCSKCNNQGACEQYEWGAILGIILGSLLVISVAAFVCIKKRKAKKESLLSDNIISSKSAFYE